MVFRYLFIIIRWNKRNYKKLQEFLVEKEGSRNTIGEIADFERGKIVCPNCNKENIRKDGLYKERKKYECGKKI